MRNARWLALIGGCGLLVGCLLPTLTPTTSVVSKETVVGFEEGVTEARKSEIRQLCQASQITTVLGAEVWNTQTPLAEIANIPGVRYVQPNYTRRLQFTDTNDPKYPSPQWYWGDMHFPEAWSGFSDLPGTGVVVAVVDSGVDTTHPDLNANIVRDAGGNIKFIDEVGTDPYYADNYINKDGQGHGTHVAGIIAGIANNGVGIVGGAPGAKILPVKTMRADGSGEDVTIAKGIKRAVDEGADVINLSVGGPEPSPLLADALAYAQRHNVLMCISAGNDGGTVNYPAAYPGAIAVGSVTRDGARAYYSCQGPELDIVAYGGGSGEEIYSTLPTYKCALNYANNGGKAQNYDYMKGTSMATPQVAAAAAVLLSKEPTLTPEQLRMRLIASARGTGFSEQTGNGILDLQRAFQWAGPVGGAQ